MYALNNEKRRDSHSICRRSVEKRFPRTLKLTPPPYPLGTVIHGVSACVSISCVMILCSAIGVRRSAVPMAQVPL